MERDCVRRISRSKGRMVRRWNNPDVLVMRRCCGWAAPQPRSGKSPDGAGRIFCGRCFYKDFAPDGAEAKRACGGCGKDGSL